MKFCQTFQQYSHSTKIVLGIRFISGIGWGLNPQPAEWIQFRSKLTYYGSIQSDKHYFVNDIFYSSIHIALIEKQTNDIKVIKNIITISSN